jgi:hypothetical protein
VALLRNTSKQPIVTKTVTNARPVSDWGLRCVPPHEVASKLVRPGWKTRDRSSGELIRNSSFRNTGCARRTASRWCERTERRVRNDWPSRLDHSCCVDCPLGVRPDRQLLYERRNGHFVLQLTCVSRKSRSIWDDGSCKSFQTCSVPWRAPFAAGCRFRFAVEIASLHASGNLTLRHSDRRPSALR